MTETWHTASTDLPLLRAAPPGYVIVDAPRPGHDGEVAVNHGGIAVVHRALYRLAHHIPAATVLRPLNF
jgi:hypothetical protein